MLAMLELEPDWSSLASMQDKARAIDAVSECSTVVGSQDVDAPQQVYSFSEVSSDSGTGVETLLFLDWDDTLFPTSWLLQQRLLDAVLPNDEQLMELQSVAAGVSRTLEEALQIGTVVIVTNAEQGWVELCCSRWMPSVAHLLQSVRIVSARSLYESQSEDPTEWKRLAFEREAELFYGVIADSHPRNILCLGDSSYEHEALRAMNDGMPSCYRKSLRFSQFPTIGQLIEQHQLVSSCLLEVAEHSDDLDVEIKIASSH